MSEAMDEDDTTTSFETRLDALTEITPDGDLDLTVGANKIRIHVNSFLLKMISKVFEAMLGSNFKEGQSNADEKYIIELPEDDVDAMKIICATVHFRNTQIPTKLSAACILRIAVAADKYDCVEALSLASHGWLQVRDVYDLKDLCHLMNAAYLFNNAGSFLTITRTMIMDHASSYTSLATEEHIRHIPLKTILLLEERRTNMVKQLNKILLENISMGIYDPSCPQKSTRATTYLQALEDYGLQLIPQRNPESLLELIRMAETMISSNSSDKEESYDCNHCGYVHYELEQYKVELSRELECLKNGNGLCLDCLHLGTDRLSDSACRIEHYDVHAKNKLIQ